MTGLSHSRRGTAAVTRPPATESTGTVSDPRLTQTMWGYQHHFRISLDSASDRALDQIGAILGP